MATPVFLGGPIQNAVHDNGFDQTLRLSITRAVNHLERSGFTVYSAHVAESSERIANASHLPPSPREI
jgi:hypothetical protein